LSVRHGGGSESDPAAQARIAAFAQNFFQSRRLTAMMLKPKVILSF